MAKTKLLLVISLLSFIVSTLSLTCRPPARTLAPDSCLRFVSPGELGVSNEAASTGCDAVADTASSSTAPAPGYRAAVFNGQQYSSVRSYAALLVAENELMWLGYRYTDSTTLLDGEMNVVQAGSFLLDSGNFGDPSVPAGAGVCVAIGRDGVLYRRTCTDSLGVVCQKIVQAPRANISITVPPGGDRFVTAGSSLRISCSVSGSDVTVTWAASLAGSTEVGPLLGSSGATGVIPKGAELFINAFSPSQQARAYYCIASNEVGSFVSDPIILVPASSSRDEDIPSVTLNVSESGPYSFGSPLTFNCMYTSNMPTSGVQWFINGRPVQESSSVQDTSSTLDVENPEEGFYQCFVRRENGDSSGGTVAIQLQPSTPSVIDQFLATPNTREEMFITWLCPEFLNTHDPLLLRYNVHYHLGDRFVSSRATVSGDIPPLLLNGSVDDNLCIIETVLRDLQPGSIYAVKVSTMGGELPHNYALLRTYGLAPGVVDDLKVTRSEDNKQVLAQWGLIDTSLPSGEIAIYHVQYRESQKGSVSDIFQSWRYRFIVISNVINANSYEVRVRVGTTMQREPLLYDYGNFSEWVKVDGITDTVPPEPPTVNPSQPLSTSPAPRIAPAAAGIAVGVIVLFIFLLILLIGLFCIFSKRLHRLENETKTTPEKASPEADMELSVLPVDERKLTPV